MDKKSEELQKLHSSVLLNEVIVAFNEVKLAHLNEELKIIDATLGLGGHTEHLIKNGFNVLGIDTDPEMLKLARERLELACPTPKKHSSWGSFTLIQGNFRNIESLAKETGFNKVAGVLFDLGVSSPQIDSLERGFSFKNQYAELDMRMDKENLSVKGSDLLNMLRKDQLFLLFRETMSYKDALNLSQNIVTERDLKKIETTGDFINIIKRSIKAKPNLNVATLPFLALRMAVNTEMDNLRDALNGAINLLGNHGRLVVISFHSGEDNYVKDFFLEMKKNGRGEVLTKDIIIAGSKEVEINPRSRSAKMRIFQSN